jgi:hypothetical protein
MIKKILKDGIENIQKKPESFRLTSRTHDSSHKTDITPKKAN